LRSIGERKWNNPLLIDLEVRSPKEEEERMNKTGNGFGRPVSRMSAAARDGGTKCHTLIDADTCVYCGVNPVSHTFTAGHGHRHEQVRVCHKCFIGVPLQLVLAKVFGLQEAELTGCRLFPEVVEVIRRDEVTS
jgi:hypothetical protein